MSTNDSLTNIITFCQQYMFSSVKRTILSILSIVLLLSFGVYKILKAGDYQPYRIKNQELQEAIGILPKDLEKSKNILESLEIRNSKDSARQHYILGVLEQKDGNYLDALRYFKKINLRKVSYLADRVKLHQAEIYAVLNQDKPLLKVVQGIEEPHSKVTADYEKARAYLRMQEKSKAEKIFKRIIKTVSSDKDEYANSLYYLGEITKNKKLQNKYWAEYLEKNIVGSFSNNIVNIWEDEGSLSDTQVTLLGKYYLEQKEYNKAEGYFNSIKLNTYTWEPLARLHIKNNNKAKAKEILIKGLEKFPDSPDYNSGINLMIRYYSIVDREQVLNKLIRKFPEKGEHILLRKLSYKHGESKVKLYKELIKKYPNSDYSGKASAEIIMSYIKHHDYKQAKAQAHKHLQRYKTSHFTSQVLFWLAKIEDKQNNKVKAQEYRDILINDFPTSYYTYRLLSSKHNKEQSLKLSKEYLKRNARYYALPQDEIIQLEPVVQELLGMNLWLEAFSLMPDNFEEQYPKLYLWYQAKVKGQIRVAINESAFKLRKASAKLGELEDYWNLAFPFLYLDHAVKEAERNNIDPLLVLALIRQESRFNKEAVSSSNAMGLAQLLPSTAKEVHYQIHSDRFKKERLFTPSYNIELGARYLAQVIRRFDNNLYTAVGSYNCGPGAMSRLIAKRTEKDFDVFLNNIKYEETREYIVRVLENYWTYQQLIRHKLKQSPY